MSDDADATGDDISLPLCQLAPELAAMLDHALARGNHVHQLQDQFALSGGRTSASNVTTISLNSELPSKSRSSGTMAPPFVMTRSGPICESPRVLAPGIRSVPG